MAGAGGIGAVESDEQEARDLMSAIAAKDRRAFETLYNRYSPRLGRYLMRLLKRGDLVDEAMNDVMLVVWQSAARYDPSLSKLSTWLFGIAHNKALKMGARAARHSAEVSMEHDTEDIQDEVRHRQSEFVEPSANPEQSLLGRELGHALLQAMNALSPDHRAVVELAFSEDYSYQEIASALDCPVNTVKTRMFYARKQLGQMLGQWGRGDEGQAQRRS